MAIDKAGSGSSGAGRASGAQADRAPAASRTEKTETPGVGGATRAEKTGAPAADSFAVDAPRDRSVLGREVRTPNIEAPPAAPAETIRASSLVAAQPAFVPGTPIAPAAPRLDATPPAAPAPPDVSVALPAARALTPDTPVAIPAAPDALAAPATPGPAPTLPDPAAALATPAPATPDPAAAVPAAASPEITLPGDVMAAPHVGGDNTVGVAADGTVSVRAGISRGADVLGGAGTFAGSFDGVNLQGQLQGGPFAGASVTGTQGPVQADGSARVTLSLQTEAGNRVAGDFEAGAIGAEFSVTEGLRGNVTFGVDMRPGDLQALATGEIPLPNPLDPSTLPVGSSLTVRGEEFSAVEGGLSVRGVGLMTGWEHASGGALQIERLDQDHVRATIGPFDRTTNSLGIEFDAGVIKAGVGVERQLLSAQVESVEFDISTDAGRAAYDRFLSSGEMAPDAAGTGNYQSIRAITDTRQITGTLEVAGLLGFEAAASDGARLIERTTPEGTSYTYNADWRGRPTEITWSQGEAGPTFGHLSLPADESIARGFVTRDELRDAQRAAAAQGQTIAPGDYSMTFNADGIRELQEGYVSQQRTRAAGGDVYYSDALRAMAASPAVTDEAWRQAVVDAMPEAYSPNQAVPEFSPMEASLMRGGDPLGLAIALSERHMLGQAQEDLPALLNRIALSQRDLFTSPNIGFAPHTIPQ